MAADYTGYTREQLLSEIAALESRLDAANAANVAKEVFLSNMSHDIRTPMNAILGMAALAQKHIDEKGRVADALNKIQTAGAHLLELINDVLDMSRINSGQLRLNDELFYLGDLMHEISIIIRPQAEKKGHKFYFDADQIEYESLTGDALRLRQIFVNIINNAVKYTPDGGEIRAGFSQKIENGACTLLFYCKDNGVGMSEEFLKRIYEPFERVNNSSISRIEGTGVGMSIVKKLLDAMHGEIRIDSAPGKGTQVYISIPVGYEHLAIDKTHLDGKHIIVIEADEGLREKYSAYFGEFSISYTLVSSAAEALDALTALEFAGGRCDLIVIGQLIRNASDPLDIAQYLQKARAGIPLVLISDADWETIEYRAQRSGISAYIPLPIFRKSLINALSKALKTASDQSGADEFPDLNGKYILLTDDNLINREIARDILSATNAHIDTAEDGAQALQMFASSEVNHYSLILMDVQMPVMDGYTAVREIRRLPREDASRVPIYAMTANTFAEDIAKALDSGMDGHIAKPIDINALIRVLRRTGV
ncbi:MAG: response regulator [Clostridia bacterium]|nr:response regulator [Clostridia bacterium]